MIFKKLFANSILRHSLVAPQQQPLVQFVANSDSEEPVASTSHEPITSEWAGMISHWVNIMRMRINIMKSVG